jgi:hypothetical protein
MLMAGLFSRRGVVSALLGSAAAVGAAAPRASASPHPAALGLGKGPRPSAVGHKFYPSGQVREWGGSTVICHAPPHSALHDGLKRIQEAAMRAPFMRKFTLLPISSLHMTIFPGVDEDHRKPPLWPSAVPSDAPIEACNVWCADRLADFHTGMDRFRMRLQADWDINGLSNFLLRLVPADAEEERRIRRLRDRLSEALQIRAPDHDTYYFHIGLGYQIEWLTPEETQAYYAAYRDWTAAFAAEVGEFTLGPAEFCVFRDMFAFQPQFLLRR